MLPLGFVPNKQIFSLSVFPREKNATGSLGSCGNFYFTTFTPNPKWIKNPRFHADLMVVLMDVFRDLKSDIHFILCLDNLRMHSQTCLSIVQTNQLVFLYLKF